MCRVIKIARAGNYAWVHGPVSVRGQGEQRIMKANDIAAVSCCKRHKGVYGSPSIVIPNRLNREISVETQEKASLTDITYIRIWQAWLYLTMVLGLFPAK